MSQTERILFIDRKIRTNHKTSVAEVAKYFEVSERQVKRDIEYLRDRFSAPIIYDRKKNGYYYEKPFNDLEFADQKMVLFYVITKSLLESGHYIPVYSEDLISQLSLDVPQDYRDVCKKISYQMIQTDNINPEFFLSICDSIRERKSLEITYINLKNETTQRLVEPEYIINYSGAWYIICWDNLRKQIRTFHLSRIKTVDVTKISFSKHTEGYPSSHYKNYKEELESFCSDSFGIFKGKRQTKVKIRFYDTASRIVQNQIWHPKQVVENGIETVKGIEKEYCDLTFPVAQFTEILSKILSFGSMAKPLAPVELIDLWKNEISKMSKM